MIQLRDGQFLTVRQHGNKFYSCVCTKEGMVSYCELPYLKVIDGCPQINIEVLNESAKKIVNFDIVKQINYVTNPDSYKNFVSSMMGHQYTVFNFKAFVVHLEEAGLVESDLYKQMDSNLKYLEKKVSINEKVFSEQIAPSVPKNWPYAMFHESSWTAYESDRALFRFAEGSVSRYADDVGSKMKDIQGFYPAHRKEATEIFNSLDEEIVADIESGVYVFEGASNNAAEEPNNDNI